MVGWLIKPDPGKDKLLKMGDWNQMKIRAVGDSVITWLNGDRMIELRMRAWVKLMVALRCKSTAEAESRFVGKIYSFVKSRSDNGASIVGQLKLLNDSTVNEREIRDVFAYLTESN